MDQGFMTDKHMIRATICKEFGKNFAHQQNIKRRLKNVDGFLFKQREGRRRRGGRRYK